MPVIAWMHKPSERLWADIESYRITELSRDEYEQLYLGEVELASFKSTSLLEFLRRENTISKEEECYGNTCSTPFRSVCIRGDEMRPLLDEVRKLRVKLPITNIQDAIFFLGPFNASQCKKDLVEG